MSYRTTPRLASTARCPGHTPSPSPSLWSSAVAANDAPLVSYTPTPNLPLSNSQWLLLDGDNFGLLDSTPTAGLGYGVGYLVGLTLCFQVCLPLPLQPRVFHEEEQQPGPAFSRRPHRSRQEGPTERRRNSGQGKFEQVRGRA